MPFELAVGVPAKNGSVVSASGAVAGISEFGIALPGGAVYSDGAFGTSDFMGSDFRVSVRSVEAARPGGACPAARRTWRNWSFLALLWMLLSGGAARTTAELQFDLFLGYDNLIREAGWFPIGIEVFNDGPSFDGVIEVSAGGFGGEQMRRVPVELPTNTRKRLTIPVFGGGGRFYQWNARLVDERGKVRAERATQQPTPVSSGGIILGALPRTFNGLPVFPETRQNQADWKPRVARLQPEQFPDNPLALEGLSALYLNSEKAIALKSAQVGALLAWLHGGGHLILSVEQLTDVSATPWLQQLLPCNLTDTVNVEIDEAVQGWLSKDAPAELNLSGRRSPRRGSQNVFNPYTGIAPDQAFTGAQSPVAVGRSSSDAQVELQAGGRPLILSAPRGRGEITLLTFSPEREPFRSWKNRGWFWARLASVPPEWFASSDFNAYGGLSIDGVFGALIDSRQVRKLPVEWLLLLLLVYLVVIGPFDQWWLKKINRQMLTWITFPGYVVLFSLLIYFIGYKLRAGETEWNELHVVDVLPRADAAELRGRSYLSVYSSANARFDVASDQPFAMLRGEFLDLAGPGKDGSKVAVEQRGNNFRAQLAVPVWTTLLYVHDWMEPAAMPFRAAVDQSGGEIALTVESLLDHPLTDLRAVVQGQVHELGTIGAREKKVFAIDPVKGTPLAAYVTAAGNGFAEAVQARRNPLGDDQRGHLDNPSLVAAAASFTRHLPVPGNSRPFVAPAGLDLSGQVERGDVVVLAWDAGRSPIKPIHRFTPPRSQKQTLLRLVIPAGSSSGA